jgi:hypothetical protein
LPEFNKRLSKFNEHLSQFNKRLSQFNERLSEFNKRLPPRKTLRRCSVLQTSPSFNPKI